MRIVLALVLVAGCLPPPEPPPEPDYGSGYYEPDGWMGSGGDPIYGCRQNSECGTQICARDGQCYPAAGVRLVSVSWTVDGAVPNAINCAAHPTLTIHFQTASQDSFGYAPVRCTNGKFTVDKLPNLYSRVELGPEGSSGTVSAIITDGAATIDLH